MAAIALVGTACGGDDPAAPPSIVSPPDDEDSGMADGGVDAGTDASMGGLVVKDTRGRALCTYDESDLVAFDAHPQANTVGIARHDERLAFVHHDPEGLPTLHIMGLSGDTPGTRMLSKRAGRGVRATYDADGRLLLGWWEGDALRAMSLGTDRKVLAAAETLLEQPGGEIGADLALGDGEVVWAVPGDGGVSLLQLDADAPADMTTRTVFADAVPDDVGLALIDDQPSVGWTRGGAFRLAPLSSPEDGVQIVDGLSGRFDLAGGPRLGAVAYAREVSGHEQVRYQSFDAAGAPELSPQDVQRAPAVLRDVSIAIFGGGYALAYRSLVSRDFPDNTIRLAFMNLTGHIVYEGELATTSRAGGATDLVTTEDGHVAVAWSDTDDGRVYVQRLDCPLALDLCGKHEDVQ